MTYILQTNQHPEGLQLGGILESLEVGERDWGSGVLGVKGLCFPNLLFLMPSSLLSSPSGTPDDDHIYVPPAFPCCCLSHHCSQPFSSYAGPPMQGKAGSCPQGGGRAGGGKAISGGVEGFLSWMPPTGGAGRDIGCVDRCVWGRRESPRSSSPFPGGPQHSASGLGRGSVPPASSLLVLVVFVFPWSTRQSAKGSSITSTVNPDIDPDSKACWDAAVEEASGESRKYAKIVGGTFQGLASQHSTFPPRKSILWKCCLVSSLVFRLLISNHFFLFFSQFSEANFSLPDHFQFQKKNPALVLDAKSPVLTHIGLLDSSWTFSPKLSF